MNNMMEIVNMLKNKNPQQLINNMIKQNSNPIINNLVSMAQSGNTKGVENFARNLYKEKGLDFDKEFSQFMGNIK